MKQHLAAIVASLALIAGCYGCAATYAAPAAPDEVDTIEHLRQATIAMVFPGEDSDYVGCSGVWISASQFLTAAHCTSSEMAISGDTSFGFVTYDDVGAQTGRDDVKRFRTAFLLARDEEMDLALLVTALPPSAHAVASLSAAAEYPGMRVHVVGHTTGLPWSYSPGWVSGLRRMKGPDSITGTFLQVFSGGWNGNSGGGVFDEDGRLLGICSFRVQGPPVSFFVAKSTVAEFLAKHGS